MGQKAAQKAVDNQIEYEEADPAQFVAHAEQKKDSPFQHQCEHNATSHRKRRSPARFTVDKRALLIRHSVALLHLTTVEEYLLTDMKNGGGGYLE